jgi:hypothetical protein
LKNPVTLSGIEPATFQLVAFKCAVNKGLMNIYYQQATTSKQQRTTQEGPSAHKNR